MLYGLYKTFLCPSLIVLNVNLTDFVVTKSKMPKSVQLNMDHASYCTVLLLFGVSWFAYGLFLYSAAELDILTVAVSFMESC